MCSGLTRNPDYYDPFHMVPCRSQDRQPLCNLPGDLREDQSLQAQIEEACKSLHKAKDGEDVETNLLKARMYLQIYDNDKKF